MKAYHTSPAAVGLSLVLLLALAAQVTLAAALNGPAALAGPPTVLTHFLVGPQPYGMAIDTTRHRLFVANYGGDPMSANTLYVFDTSTTPPSLVKARGYISRPWGVAVNPTLGCFYVSSFDGNYVIVANSDTTNAITYPPTGDGPAGIAIDQATNRVFVANYRGNSVTVIDGNTNMVIGNPIPVSRGPMGIALDPGLHRAYITCYEDSVVDIIDTSALQRYPSPFTGAIHPSGIAVDPNTHYIYIANSDATSTALLIIDKDNNRIVHPELTVGTRPVGVLYNPLTERIFVNCASVNKVYVVETSTNQVSYILDVQQRPDIGITLDQVANRIYVGNVNSNSVTIIQDGSPTPTATPTATATPTTTLPQTNTPTHTPIGTPMATPTRAYVVYLPVIVKNYFPPTPVPTATHTPTRTPMATNTLTATPAPTNTPTVTLTPTNTPTPKPCPQFRAGRWEGTADFTVPSDRNRVVNFELTIYVCYAQWQVTAPELPISNCGIQFAASDGSATIWGNGTFISETEMNGSFTLITSTCLGWGSWSSGWRSAAPEP